MFALRSVKKDADFNTFAYGVQYPSTGMSESSLWEWAEELSDFIADSRASALKVIVPLLEL